jgi:uncharacterized membrane protein YfcA
MPAWFDSLLPALPAIALVTLVAGLVRGFTGFGAGLVMAPLFSLVLGPSRAVPLLVALELVASARLVPEALSSVRPRTAFMLGLPACLGIPLGSVLLIHLDGDLVRRVIALVVLAFVGAMAAGWRRKRKATRVVVGVAGALSGTLTGLGGVGGPPVVLLLLSGPSSAAHNRANLIIFFALTQVAATLAFAVGGLLVAEVLWGLLILSPVFLLGTHLGASLFEPARERLYRRLSLALLAVIAVVGLV